MQVSHHSILHRTLSTLRKYLVHVIKLNQCEEDHRKSPTYTMLTHQHTHRSHLEHVSSSTNKGYGMTCHLDKNDKDVQVHKSEISITEQINH